MEVCIYNIGMAKLSNIDMKSRIQNQIWSILLHKANFFYKAKSKVKGQIVKLFVTHV